MLAMRRFPLSSLVLCLALILAVPGCVGRLPHQREVPKVSPQEALAPLTPAMEAYQEGDYDRAADLFLTLSLVTSDPVLARKALYGLACSRLATAESEADMNEALEIWNRWASLAVPSLDIEDPRLLTPVLPRIAPDGSDTKETVENMEKEMGKLRTRLKQKSAELDELKNQLDALEQLHQEITIRKQGIN